MKHKRTFCLFAGTAMALVLAIQPVMCQRPGGGAGAGGPGTAPGGSVRTPPPNTPGRNTTNPSIDLNRGIFLSGKVMMDDGTAPPEPVRIERICSGGAPRAEAYTDSKGRFSFQMGQNTGITQDASFEEFGSPGQQGAARMPQSNGRVGQDPSVGTQRTPRQQDLMGCEIRAALAGFRSDNVNLAGRRMLDNPEVGTIVLHRLANVEGTTISATTLQAPKDARKAYEKALEASRKGKVEDARKNLEKAVNVYPQFAAAWSELGAIHEKNNDLAEARKCYAQSIASDPKLLTPYLHLAQLSAMEKNWQEVDETTDRLIKLDPVDLPEAYYFNAVANYNLKKFGDAEVSARAAQKIDTAQRFPKIEHILGAILYEKQDYAGAAEQMRLYLQLTPGGPDTDRVRTQLAEVEKLAGDTKAKAEKPQQ